MSHPFILVVGAGFAGAVCARELAYAGHNVLVVDRRSHIGGNAFDQYDSNGVLVHPYGPHIFHTNSIWVVEWLSRFTKWHPYEHRVLAKVGSQLLPIPINRTTINQLYGLSLDEAGISQYLKMVQEPRISVRTSEDVVLASVGSDLCEKFFRGYTRKQWGLDLSQLSAGVAARIPVRTNDDDRYFADNFQAMPQEGYTRMFQRIFHHPNIRVSLDTDFVNMSADMLPVHTVFTGPIDAFFKHCYGRLPYRSLRFEHEHLPGIESVQSVGTVNYPNDYEYTRITEFKHITGQSHSGTSIVREYPEAEGEPFYPVPRKDNEALFQKYRQLADEESNVTFVGRLAQYRYYNMDQVIAAALTAINKLINKLNN